MDRNIVFVEADPDELVNKIVDGLYEMDMTDAVNHAVSRSERGIPGPTLERALAGLRAFAIALINRAIMETGGDESHLLQDEGGECPIIGLADDDHAEEVTP